MSIISNNIITRFFSRRAITLAFAAVFIIWGSTFMAIAYGLKGFPPFLLSALRFLIAGILLITLQAAKGEAVFVARYWLRNAIPGLLILTAGTGLVAWSEQYVSSAEAAIMGATAPFWFIAIDRVNWKHYLSDKLVMTGLAGGFAGLIIFVSGSINGIHTSIPQHTRSIAFIVLALSAVAWVLGSLYSKKKPAGGTNILNAGQQLIAGGVSSLIVSFSKNEVAGFSFAHIPYEAWLGLFFLIVMGSIIAYQSYIWLLSVRPPALVSVHTYINPVVAVIIGLLFLGERISGIQLIGLSIILIGVFMTNISRYQIKIRTKVRLRQKVRYAWGTVNNVAPGITGLVNRISN
jgi:drug/metabolite transporter (DMT)-like permease